MPVGTVAERAAFFEADQKWRRDTETLRRQLHAIEHPVLLKHATREGFEKFIDKIKVMIRKRPEDRTAYERQIAEMASRQFDLEQSKLPERLKDATKAEWEKLHAQLKQFEANRPKPLPTVKFVVSDAGPVAPVTRIPKRDTVVEPGFLTLLDPGDAVITPPPAALQSTGRRTALANWITRADNPFTARVMVNRMWQQHFGRGLATNTSDFGKLGTPPTHPELLDWLATRLVAEGWSLKNLHRLMVTSATYRQDSNHPTAEQADPANTWFARATVQRMDAEQMRDSLLAASGELNLKTGGAGEDGARSVRRSVYLKVMRNKPDAVLAAFDAPDRISHMPQRTVTTTATQSLLLLNSDWARQRANAFARRLHKLHPGDPNAQVRAAHQLTFGRESSVEHLASGIAYLNLGGEVAANPEPPKIGMFGKRSPSWRLDSARGRPARIGSQAGQDAHRRFHGRGVHSAGFVVCRCLRAHHRFPMGQPTTHPRLGVGRHEHEERLSAAQSDPATYRHPAAWRSRLRGDRLQSAAGIEQILLRRREREIR